MTILTEGKHAGEFIVSEANGTRSREVGTLLSGENVVDGTLLRMNAGKLEAVVSGDVSSTEGLPDFEGIVIGNWDATGGDISDVPYIARASEVQDDQLTYPEETTEGGEKAACIAAMKAVGIVVR